MGEYAGVVGGIGTMMSVRQEPWHYSMNKDRVRMVEHNVQSGAQALTLAKIDWEVEKVSLNDLTIGLPNAEDYALALRKDTRAVLGIHKKGYGLIQNSALGDVADAIIAAQPEAFIDTAGSLFEPGKVTWVLVTLPEAWDFGDGEYHRHVLICTSHDGSRALSIRHTAVRVVCMNTFSGAVEGTKALYTVRHTTNATEYVTQAKTAMAESLVNWQAFEHQVESLLAQPLDAAEFATSLIPAVVGERPEETSRTQTNWDNRFASIMATYMADHNDNITDTAWGAVNAFQEYEQWGRSTRGDLGDAQMRRLMEEDWSLSRKALALLS